MKDFRKYLCAGLVLFVFLIGACLQSAEAKTIRINKPRIIQDLNKGESATVEITVTNPTEEEAVIKVYPEDWEYTASGSGEKNFYPAGTFDISASQWLTYAPQEFTLPPLGEQVVTLTTRVPNELPKDGTYYALLFFETTLGETVNAEGASVIVAGRVGALVYVNIEGTVIRSGQINDIRMTPGTGNKPTAFVVTFTNTGNTYIPLEGEFIVFAADGQIKGRGELATMYTREGMRVSSETLWPTRLEPGTYDFIFTFDMGDGDAIVEERQFIVE